MIKQKYLGLRKQYIFDFDISPICRSSSPHFGKRTVRYRTKMFGTNSSTGFGISTWGDTTNTFNQISQHPISTKRFFRVSINDLSPEKYWVAHDFVNMNPLYKVIQDVKRFMRDTKEIVIMDFHRYAMKWFSNTSTASIWCNNYILCLRSGFPLASKTTTVKANPWKNMLPWLATYKKNLATTPSLIGWDPMSHPTKYGTWYSQHLILQLKSDYCHFLKKSSWSCMTGQFWEWRSIRTEAFADHLRSCANRGLQHSPVARSHPCLGKLQESNTPQKLSHRLVWCNKLMLTSKVGFFK